MNGMQQLALAIEEDHPCYDRGCDVAAALGHGFVRAAAILLTGATETPTVDAVIAKYKIDLGTVHGPAFQKWAAWRRKYGRLCEECESYTYAYPGDDFEPSRCADCLAPLPGTDRGFQVG